ncbi:tRNA glutamyl-Q(34) synthetase GluQRS [Pseudoalteromonas phenolica]|uniref:Glutamyl-Q tRNA(Asp) synthetase n=1 Tax=Pseudoalteromonas phenolica TaxID=161398 RepID=A0A0S2JZ38_9GAMM|nr:tRNA glutamyl-Q(34) synthetase GluQRS [Pseudoalteromonas phenolica]ALO41071.1 glutamyl-Q tRNA(Asp) ligase [Pseudoalteromonas phenolica]RXE94025.1 tRNA glutamyl-Q(34) synthetase GluQRS [Pseudoalteromonas phenolica O-BC30]
MHKEALSDSRGYRGRFAPSPSGPLHFGSLVAALASYLDAKVHQGAWLVRMEDIDTPRVVQGADNAILTALEKFGLHWDEQVEYQSQRHALYQHTLTQLKPDLYACNCTRKMIKQAGGLYQGHCKSLALDFSEHAIRLTQTHPIYQFTDLLQGQVNVPQDLADEDYIVKRRDGLFAYQLVVVVDDIEQKISRVVRGADLLEPTARQISLFKQLGYTVPEYAHVPLAVTEPGFKLSKQNHAPAINIDDPIPELLQALSFLGLSVTDDMKLSNVEEILTWASTQFSLAAIPQVLEKSIKL